MGVMHEDLGAACEMMTRLLKQLHIALWNAVTGNLLSTLIVCVKLSRVFLNC